MSAKLDDDTLSKIDRKLNTLRAIRDNTFVANGWIKYMRNALGLTLADLSRLSKISIPTISQAETREVNGKVSVTTLKKLANAMECELIYAFVPKKTLQETIYDRAIEKARTCLFDTEESLNLEASKRKDENEEEVQQRVEKLAKKLIEKGNVW